MGNGDMIQENFIDELKALFKKYDIYLDVYDNYDGEERFAGKNVEIKSYKFVDGKLPIFIEDIEKLSGIL